MERTRLTFAIAAVIFAALCSPGFAQEGQKKAEEPKARIEQPAPDFTLPDPSGKEYSLGHFKGKYVVLEWTNMDCPFVRKHYDSGNIQTLQKNYAKQGVVWLRICSSAPGTQGHFERAVIEDRLKKEKSMAVAYLVDSKGTVGRLYGAKTTPHMFVLNPEGVIIYAGAIDDKPSTNKADIKAAVNYVSACLDSAMKGEKVAVKTSVPYGCSVKYAKAATASSSY